MGLGHLRLGKFSFCNNGNGRVFPHFLQKIEDLSGYKLNYEYSENNRSGDHICYYTDMSKFKKDYPLWCKKYNLSDIIKEIIEKT